MSRTKYNSFVFVLH